MTLTKTFALVIALIVSGASQVFARPVESQWERALIDDSPNYASPSAPPEPDSSTSQVSGHGRELIDIGETRTPNSWPRPSGPCCCTENGDATSARIDGLLSEYGQTPIDELAVGREWSRRAIGCAAQLLEENRFPEAVRFCQREMQRAHAYRGEVNLGHAAVLIESQLRHLLIDADLFGCD